MTNTKAPSKLFVLDTNILMHDPSAIYHFEENDIYLPMVVLEELDSHKTGLSEVARNVRQTNRMLVELMNNATHSEVVAGIPIHSYTSRGEENGGRLFFQTHDFEQSIPSSLPGSKADNTLLSTAIGLQKKFPHRQVVLISKDINLRIKAGILGIPAEDYFNDHVLDDVSLLHSGLHLLENDFWESHGKDIEVWQETGKTFYKITGPLTQKWSYNDCISTKDNQFQAIVKRIESESEHVIVQLARDYTQPKHAVWGITAKNREQNFTLNLLLDPDIDFVTLQGPAGTGKTLLSIAAGLTQVLDQPLYNEIIMTRVTIPVGEDIGFLPGTEEEKMTPWMGALMDNLEVLHCTQEGAFVFVI